MTCIKKSSIKEILYWLNIKDPTCIKKVLKFNRILRMFYADTYAFRQNIVTEWINSASPGSHTTWYPIYRIRWFFGTGTWPCFEKTETCGCCPSWSDYIKMREDSYGSNSWTYSISAENEVKFNLPCEASNVHIVYSRWPISISSICDTIAIDQFMLTGLEFLIEWFYERNDWNQNRQQLVQSDYYKWLEAAKKLQDNSIQYIWK